MAVALLAALPYLNAVRAGFTYDDVPTVQTNPVVTGGVDLIGAFSAAVLGSTYRPLTLLSFAGNWALTRDEPAVFHAANIVLHAGVSVMVLLFGMELFGSLSVATIGAVLFAVHPVHTEAVTSIVGRAELLAALFGLAAVLSGLRAQRARGRARRVALEAASVGSFCLALLSKESAVTVLPLLFWLRVSCREDGFGMAVVRELRSGDWVPYVACLAAFVGLRAVALSAAGTAVLIPLNNPLAFTSWAVRLRSAMAILWDYFGLLTVPLVLSADYSYNQVPLVSWVDPHWLAGVAVIAAAGVVALRHRSLGVRAAAGLPLLTLMVTANVFCIIPTAKAERLLYLPSVGWALLAAYGGDRLSQHRRYRRLAVAGLAGIVGVFAARTWVRNGDWLSNLTLDRSIVRSAPDSAKGHYNLAVDLQRLHADTVALREFRRSMEIYPWAPTAFGIGVSLQHRGAVEAAAHWYQRAIDLAPGYVQAYGNLCSMLYRHGRYAEAVAACRRGLRYDPANVDLLAVLGHTLVAGGAPAEGGEILRDCRALDPIGHGTEGAEGSRPPAEVAGGSRRQDDARRGAL